MKATMLGSAFVVVNLCHAFAADADELRFGADELYRRAVTENVCLSDDGQFVELGWGQLIEDDGPAAGYSYRPNVEKLGEGVKLKKTLLVPRPAAKHATLLIARGGELQLELNGHAVALPPPEKSGNYWHAYAIDPARLHKGENEFIFSGSGSVYIARDDEYHQGSLTRSAHPDRSAKSTDGGSTWTSEKLGTDGNVDGEYYVRLYLDQYAPRGTLKLPVIDLGNLAEKPLGPPIGEIGFVRFAAECDLPDGGMCSLRVRTGTTYVPDEQRWSPWREIDGLQGTIDQPAGRYLQIEIELTEEDPLVSPQLRNLKITANPEPSADWTERVTILKFENESIVRSSIPFTYEPFDHPKLKRLRTDYRLDEVAAGAESELELLQKLAAWSSGCWQGLGHLRDSYPPWDSLAILEKMDDGRPVGGFCHQFNLVFLQACESFGFVGRAVSIGPGNRVDWIRGGHEVVEIWSNQFKKWIYIDGNTSYYAVDQETGVPLSLLELHDRQLAARDERPHRPIRIIKLADTKYEWESLDGWPPFVELRLVPRSNFLETPYPLPLNQGMRGWSWTGHFVWADQQTPGRKIYSHHVVKRENFEWTLNQAHLVLEASKSPGVIHMHVDTVAPGLETLVSRRGDDSPAPVGPIFEWELQPGENRLVVFPRNIAGRDGIASEVRLRYDR